MIDFNITNINGILRTVKCTDNVVLSHTDVNMNHHINGGKVALVKYLREESLAHNVTPNQIDIDAESVHQAVMLRPLFTFQATGNALP